MLKNLEHFVQVLKIEKNHSSNTINSYLSDIKSFEKYLIKRRITFKKIINESDVIKKYFRSVKRFNGARLMNLIALIRMVL